MTSRNSSKALFALLAVPLLLGIAAPAAADWFGISVGGDDFAFSLGVGDWGPYGSAWQDPGWNVDYRVALNGYGQWVRVDGLGEVWCPSVAADWRPYTYGRWVYTGMGWTWVSYEPWGYFPHHYGEWALTGFGWVWVPGYTYRPANVVWVGYGSYVGWYPCAPAGWSHSYHGFWHGYEHGYRRGYDDGYADGWHDARYATYVPWNSFTSDDVAHAALDPREVGRSLTRANARTLAAPPSRSEVSRLTGRTVPEVRVEERQVRVDGRTVTVARPEGATRSVATHAGETIERALAPEAARQAAGRQERATPSRTATGGTQANTTATRPLTQARAPERERLRSTAADARREVNQLPTLRSSAPSVGETSATTRGQRTARVLSVPAGRSATVETAPQRETTQVNGSSRNQASASPQAQPVQTSSTRTAASRPSVAERTSASSSQPRPAARSTTAQAGSSPRVQTGTTSPGAAAAARSGRSAATQPAAATARTRRTPAGPKPDEPGNR